MVLFAFAICGIAGLAGAASASAADPAGRPANSTFISFDLSDRSQLSVNVLTGNLLLEAADLRIKGVGEDLSFSRAYNSQSNDELGFSADGSFGRNWRAVPFDARVGNPTQYRNNRTFDPGNGSTFPFDGTPSAGFEPPAGIDADMSGGSAGAYAVTFRASRTRWKFDSDGDLSVVDRNQNTVKYFPGSGGTTVATDTQGREITAVRNASGSITKLIDPSSRHSDYAYGTSGSTSNRLTSYTDASGNVSTYGYDAAGQLNRVTTAAGRITKITYDSANRVSTVTRVTNTVTEAGNVTSYSYGQTNTACANGSATTQATKVTDARGAVTSYCPSGTDGSVADVIDPLGRHQSSSYDTQGHITAQGTGSALTTSSYNGNGTISNSTAPAGEKTTFAYAGSGAAQYQPSSVTDADNHSQFFGYDGSGNLTSVKDSNSATPSMQSAMTYNPDGTLASAKDGENRTTTYGYYGMADGVKQGYLRTVTPPTVLSTMTQPGPTTLNYDGLGHVTSATDGRGKVTSYTYDDLDRTKKITFDGGSSITYSYDADGNQTQRVDSSGGTYNYAYDTLGRRTHEGLPGARSVDYAYDEVGNLKSLIDGSATTRYGYDLAGQPCFVATTTSASGTCSSPPTGSTTFSYDGVGNRTSTAFPNGVSVTGTFDASRKPTVIAVKKGATVLDDRTYTYKTYSGSSSPNGELLASMATPHDGGGWTYGYNSSGLLSQAVRPSPLPSGGTEQTDYLYDKAGNRTRKTTMVVDDQGSVPEQTSYSYNAVNQLCALAPSCSTPGSGAAVFSYDAGGNDLRFGYNDRNQTTSGGGSLAYAGPNQFELIDDAGSTIENNLLGAGRKINGIGTTTYTRDSAGTLLYRTLPNGQTQYYALDALGSVIDLTDSTGARTAAYKYDPDGNATTSAAIADFGFTGAYLRDGSKPLYHNGLRWYDPSIGRWTQPDMLDQPADLSNANRYVYAGSNPVNFTDPSGMQCIWLKGRKRPPCAARATRPQDPSKSGTGIPKPPNWVCAVTAVAAVPQVVYTNPYAASATAAVGLACQFGDD